jgi:hypothetical protein
MPVLTSGSAGSAKTLSIEDFIRIPTGVVFVCATTMDGNKKPTNNNL